jgi:hypothetical protein
VYTKDKNRDFSTYDLRRLHWHRGWHCYAASEDVYSAIEELHALHCPECHVQSDSIRNLKKHVKEEHHKQYCELCVSGSKRFINELPLYTSKELQQHRDHGDGTGAGFKGHPECRFCRQFFYAEDELFAHMNQKHERCFLCERMGKHYQYWANYGKLEEHFRSNHFMCTAQACLDRKFVVFASDVELKAHIALEHDPSARDRKGRGARLDLASLDSSGSHSSHAGTSAVAGDVLDLTRVANIDSGLPQRTRAEIRQAMLAAAENAGAMHPRMPVPSSSVSSSLGARSSHRHGKKQHGQHHDGDDGDGSSQSLASRIKAALGGDDTQFRRFQTLANDYRKGLRGAPVFLKSVRDAFGSALDRETLIDVAHTCPDDQQRADLIRALEDERDRQLYLREQQQIASVSGNSAASMVDATRNRVELWPGLSETSAPSGSGTTGPAYSATVGGSMSSSAHAAPAAAVAPQPSGPAPVAVQPTRPSGTSAAAAVAAASGPSPWAALVSGRASGAGQQFPTLGAAVSSDPFPALPPSSGTAHAGSSSRSHVPHDSVPSWQRELSKVQNAKKKDKGKNKGKSKWNMYSSEFPEGSSAGSSSRPVENAWQRPLHPGQ